MNKLFNVFFTMLFLLSIGAGELFAEDENGYENYDKTFSVAVDPLGFALLGPSVQAEVTVLGPVGIYGSYQQVSFGYMANMYDDIEIEGFAASGGARYYLNYGTKYLDSSYIGIDYTYVFMKAEDELDQSIDLTGNMFAVRFGRRWQWDLVFLDLNAGAGLTSVSTKMDGAFDEQDKKDLEDSLNGLSLEVQFMVGCAF